MRRRMGGGIPEPPGILEIPEVGGLEVLVYWCVGCVGRLVCWVINYIGRVGRFG